ncbi:Uncharacterised protein [uncultured archaeon]|nr:Uncharacterised protein [uncultured archaeon]
MPIMDAIKPLVSKPSLHMLNSGKIKPALLPSPPAWDFVFNIKSTTLASPTLDFFTCPPSSLINLSIDTLVSMLRTNFLYPISNALATPNPKVTSGACFLPSFTTTNLSPSRSKANAMSDFCDNFTKSSSLSTVGSGPREDLPGFSFTLFIMHPILFRSLGATSKAAPPPTSSATFGLPFT